MTNAADASRSELFLRQSWQPILALPITVSAAGIAVWSGTIDDRSAAFWLIGIAIGFVLQRSRFCFTSAFRDLFLLRDGRVMKGVIAGMAVATMGFALIMSDRLPNPRVGAVALDAHVSPLALALILGGLAFGLGMVLAGGCVSGSMYRMAEGYLGSWVAFAGILTGLLGATYTWNWWWELDIGRAPRIWLPNLEGYGGAAVATLLALTAAYVLVLWVESRDGLVVAAPTAPGPPAESFRDKLAHTYRVLFQRSWPAITGGLALGTLNVFLFAYEHPWRIVGELSAWSSALAGRVGLSPPTLLGLESIPGCTLSGAEGGILNHMTFSNLGLFAGALLSALLAREFRPRIPRRKTRYAQSLGGGLLMGYGAGLAIGCTVGAFFSAIPSLGANGWLFAAALAGGAYLGTKLIRRLA